MSVCGVGKTDTESKWGEHQNWVAYFLSLCLRESDIQVLYLQRKTLTLSPVGGLWESHAG